MLSNNINQMTEEHRKGKIKEICYCVNSETQGVNIEYYESGNTESIYKFVDNEIHGRAVGYYENGVVKWECVYENDKIQGKYVEYYENGDILKELNYVDGEIQGLVVQYHKFSEDECDKEPEQKITNLIKKNYYEFFNCPRPESIQKAEITKYKNGEEKSKIYLREGKIVGIYDN